MPLGVRDIAAQLKLCNQHASAVSNGTAESRVLTPVPLSLISPLGFWRRAWRRSWRWCFIHDAVDSLSHAGEG